MRPIRTDTVARSRRRAGSLAALLLLAGLGCVSIVAADGRVVAIGVVYDGPPPDDEVLSVERLRKIPALIRDETLALTERDFDVRFPQSKTILGDWSSQSIRDAVETLLADPEVDLVLTLGVFSSSYAAGKRDLPKPVVAPFAVDVLAQSLPFDGGASGVRNLNYQIRRGNVVQDLRKFRSLVGFDRLHVVIDSLFLQLTPESHRYAAGVADLIGAEAELVPATASATEVLDALEGAEAVYVTPLVRMPTREFDALVAGLIQRRIPSFSLLGELEVERGILAGLRRATDASRVARRVALNVQRILLGEDAGTLPVVIDQPEKLLINLETAERIGYYPRWSVTLEADVIGTDTPWGESSDSEPLTLSAAVIEAVEANLSLFATDLGVDAARENIRRARSGLRPSIELTATDVRIDGDRAQASLGSLAENTFSAGVALSQLVYSDRVLAGVDLATDLQRSLEQQREVVRLDVALAAATSFLDVLRAETLERVERENASLTESNLELARRREAVGFSGPADVYRWESRLATDRSNLIKAHNAVHVARLALNRALNRPLPSKYEAVPPRLEDPRLVTGFGRLNPYIDNPAGFGLFREFSVREGSQRSPELRALDAAISAKRRESVAAKRSYWRPTVSLVGQIERSISESAATESAIATAFSLPMADRDDWSLSLQGRLPLYAGGSRLADFRQTTEELSELRVRRQALEQSIELRIRTGLWAVGGTFPSIELAEEAARAARSNLELVTDAYSRGVVSIIDLLDAQNAARVADAFAANAVYDFLLDLMELQRATNDFDFFRSEAGREAWFERLETFFEEAGHTVRRPER